MKRVFQSAEQTIHIWAQQTQSEGRSANVFFEGATVYSYGYHYPLGLITTNKKGEKAAIINDAGYSSTTSKHIGAARYAVNHYKRFDLPNTNAMKALVEAQSYNQPIRITNGLSEAIEHTIAGYHSRLRSDTVKRKAATLEKWKSETLSECNNYIELLDWYGVKMTAKAKKALRDLTGKSPSEAKEQAKKEAIRIKKANDKLLLERQAREKVAIDEAVRNFLAGGNAGNIERDYLCRSVTVYLRVHGDNIETSKGAYFPIGHAVKAFAFIQTVMKRGEAWHKNGKTVHLGHFQLDSIAVDGTVIAGCHTVQYSEIERIAKQLKLI